MEKPNESQQVVTGITPEISKKNLAQEVYSDRKLGKEIVEKAKWSLDIQKQNGNKIPWSPEATEEKLSGYLRGLVAEAVSNKISLTSAQNVFTYGDTTLAALKVVSPQEYAGSITNRKGDVLSHILAESFEKKPLRVFDPNIHLNDNLIISQFKLDRLISGAPRVSPQDYAIELRRYMENKKDKMQEEIIKGYAYAPKKGDTIAGEWYDSTVIPDGIILDKEGVPAGVLEVKAYSPADELAFLLKKIEEGGKSSTYFEGKASDFGKTYPGANIDNYKMGVELDKETEFVDIIRGVSGKGADRDASNLVLLRFPSDIPDNLLMQYGEKIVSCGYRNVVIQKLPFSGEELNVIAKEIVKHQWGNLDLQLYKLNFSNREIEVFKNWAGVLD